jgi:PAS domain-containing protein
MYSAGAALSISKSQPASDMSFDKLNIPLNRSLDTGRWQTVLEKITSVSGSDCCVLGRSDLTSPLPTLVPAVRVGGSPSAVESMRACLTQLRSAPAGTVAVIDDEHAVGGKRGSKKTMSVVGTSLVNGIGHSLVLAACRRRQYQTKEKHFFERLAPRLSRLGVSLEADRLELTKIRALNAVFDGLAAAVFITDCDAHVLYANAAAGLVLARGKGLYVRDGQLTTRDKSSAKSLSDAIERLCSGGELHCRISVVLQPHGEQALLATVVPLTKRDNDKVLDTAGAAVFVSDPDLESLIPGEGFAKLYNLTACELSLLRSMLPGRCVKGAAEAQGIGEATARTHLHHIFMKTGTNKQVELMQLFSSYALPMLAEPEDNRPTTRQSRKD